ncbi:hypothetical protein XbrCFBP1976_18835 [Xanthomonas bromi]|uniref:Uncharacterized protein n=1 Tax=Xanthomonas bromi TaxID=56449 RepID=A0ABX5BKG2_9XANT|nr:hypothetical protein XbrCFBP1976_18835 [Xanthomonas bromi]
MAQCRRGGRSGLSNGVDRKRHGRTCTNGIATRYRVAAPAAPLDDSPEKEWLRRAIMPCLRTCRHRGNLPAPTAACVTAQRGPPRARQDIA